MLDVRRMRVLREVAARGSFSAAADALDYTQSAISQQIAALEREAGTMLVERSAGGVRLTDAGRALVEHADAILARLSDAEAELEAIAGLRGGRLRLAAFPRARASVMPQGNRAFRRVPERRRVDQAGADRALPRAPPGGRAHPGARRARAGVEPPARRRGRHRTRHHGLLPGAGRGRHRAPAPARRPDVRRAAQEPPAGPQAGAEAREAGRRELDPRHHGLVPRRLDLPALLPGRRLRAADRLQLRRLLRHAGLRRRRRRRVVHPRPRPDVRPRGHRGPLAGPEATRAPDHGRDAEGLLPLARQAGDARRPRRGRRRVRRQASRPRAALIAENADIVRRAFDAFSRRYLSALLAIADPDIEFMPATARVAGRGEPYRGHEGLRTYLADAARVWQELRSEPEEFIEVDDVVVCTGRVYAWGVGRVIDAPAGWVWRLRAGRIVEGRVYDTRREALAAAGLERG